ncbi:FAD:protein FMN transferase [Streptococcus ictaluri]|uniref:FAD:protein FMN transferase n=1 Tax=Streptococcus ictaluri 707-05 TaxID=764299 RepID=G5K3D8_9STRE|nr:FAD:protein FMN transferase [Streptococcus ictaluri]EHI69593.1 ApbE family protein [Streptococcus ictaluri 707-05]
MLATDRIKLMGTVIDLQIISDKADTQLQMARELLITYKNRFSANDDDSELMAINHQAGVEPLIVHPDLFELIHIGKEHSLAQPSNLNIAIGPLVQTWRIGFPDANKPSQEIIRQKLALSQPRLIHLNSKTQSVFLEKEGMTVDLGALAKGYIADKIMAYLIQDGIDSALINLGGNVLVHGINPNRPDGFYYIGIQEPGQARGQNMAILKAHNQSVVTSGIYERYLTINNVDYHHIFDCQTGYPIETEMASLTIVAKSSLDCEIWTTRLFGLSLKKVYDTLNQLDGIEGIIITKDKQVLFSRGLEGKCQLLYH